MCPEVTTRFLSLILLARQQRSSVVPCPLLRALWPLGFQGSSLGSSLISCPSPHTPDLLEAPVACSRLHPLGGGVHLVSSPGLNAAYVPGVPNRYPKSRLLFQTPGSRIRPSAPPQALVSSSTAPPNVPCLLLVLLLLPARMRTP